MPPTRQTCRHPDELSALRLAASWPGSRAERQPLASAFVSTVILGGLSVGAGLWPVAALAQRAEQNAVTAAEDAFDYRARCILYFGQKAPLIVESL